MKDAKFVTITPQGAMRLLYDSIIDRNIHPELAEQLLNGVFVATRSTIEAIQEMVNNRTIRPNTVRDYAALMHTGNFEIDGSTVGISVSGKVVNGFHRLLACIAANTPFSTFIAQGLSDTAMLTADTNLARTYADAHKVRGEKNAPLQAGIKIMLYRYHTSAFRSGRKVNAQLTDALIENLNLGDLVSQAAERVITGTRAPKGIPPSLLGFLWVIGQSVDSQKTDRFIEDVKTGVNLAENSPAYQLRERLGKRQAGGKAYQPKAVLGMAIKAFNSALQDKTINLLRFCVTGKVQETIPYVYCYPPLFPVNNNSSFMDDDCEFLEEDRGANLSPRTQAWLKKAA